MALESEFDEEEPDDYEEEYDDEDEDEEDEDEDDVDPEDDVDLARNRRRGVAGGRERGHPNGTKVNGRDELFNFGSNLTVAGEYDSDLGCLQSNVTVRVC